MRSLRWLPCAALLLTGVYFLYFHLWRHKFDGPHRIIQREVTDDMVPANNSDTVNQTMAHQTHSQTVSLSRNYHSHLKLIQPHYFLAAIVLSSIGNRDRRDAIRNTWKDGYRNRTHYLKFVMGTLGVNSEDMDKLRMEEAVYKDMLFFPDLVDEYHSLTRKVLKSFVWMDHNLNYSYLLKSDDDSFILIDRIEDDLRAREDSRGLYWGYFIGNALPKKEGPWAEDKWIFCDLYVPYAFGGGYILSSDVVHRIAVNADGVIVFNNEDVAVGAWTAAFDIERKHDIRFDTTAVSRGCKNSFLITHKQSIEDLQAKHKLYTTTGNICQKEEVWTESEYNWKAPPSKCYSQ